jgi:hypothetical protein
MHWLMVALALRGELPEAREASAILLGLAEARNNRPALLNALRAVSLMNLLTGRIVEAQAMAEQMVKEFGSSNEAERTAARAAGQDAGSAGLAVMSWALWLLGYVDQAVARIVSALQRADAVNHPHTQAYACYYASVLYVLRGEPLVAHEHAKRCHLLSEEHGFRQWRAPSRAIHTICTTMLKPSADNVDQVMSEWDEYRGAGYQFGMTAVCVLLCGALLLRRQFARVLEVVEHGLSICGVNNERFLEAELYRLKARAVHLMNELNPDNNARSLLDKALQIAQSQTARSLELRAVLDLAGLLRDQGKRTEARDLLAPIYGWFTEGFDTPVLKEAKALLEQLTE